MPPVGAQESHVCDIDRFASVVHRLQRAHHVHRGLQDDRRRDQIQEAQALLLLDRIVLVDDVAAEVQPLGEGVVRLDLVGHACDLLAHVLAADPTQQVGGAQHAAQLARGLEELVVAPLGAELAKQEWRRDHALLHGDGHLHQFMWLSLIHI